MNQLIMLQGSQDIQKALVAPFDMESFKPALESFHVHSNTSLITDQVPSSFKGNGQIGKGYER